MKYTALSYSVTVYSTQLLSDSTHHSVTQWQDAELSWSVTVYSNHSITVHSTQSLSDSIQHSVAQWQYTALSHSKTEYSTQHSVTQWQNTALIRTVTVYNTQSFSDSIHLVYSELFTDCPYKQVLSISIKLSTLCHSFFSDTAPVYLLTFSVSTLRQDSCAPPPTQELYTFRTWSQKHLDIAHFPMPLLSGILCLAKLDTLSQPLRLELLWRLICSNPTSAS